MVRAQDGAQEELLEIFKSDTFADTVRQVGQGRCSDASTDVLLLWEFVGLKVYPRLSKDYRNFVEKGNVNGPNARPLHTWLKQQYPEKDGSLDISWNFAKFLVDRHGKAYKRYAPQEDPWNLLSDIESLLA